MLLLVACDGRSEAPQGTIAQGNETSRGSPDHSQPTRSGYADVEGGRVYYQVYGELGSGRTPLLVLHGSFMSGAAMQPLVDRFAPSRPVITIDARGHGRTGDLPGPITYDLMADDSARVLAALNVRTADVIGYSMGAVTAIALAIRHPDRVGKQIIIAGTSRRDGWRPEVFQAVSQMTPANFAGSRMAAEYRRLSPTPNAFPTLVGKLRDLERSNYDRPDAAVRAIPGKTMIIVGDTDGVSLDHAVALFRLRGGDDRQAAARGVITEAPRARLAILPATAHVGLMSETALIAALAIPFLDDRKPAPPEGLFADMNATPSEVGTGTR